MVSVTISVDEEMHEVFRIAAKLRGITVEEYLCDVLAQSAEELKAHMNDPLVGSIRSGRGDLSERDEELLQSGWQPD